MKELWRQGSASVREVHDSLGPRLGWVYSTTKTTLDRMVRKKYLHRESFHGVFLYRPLLSRPAGLVARVREFAERVLEADAQTIVPLFAKAGSLTPDELEELERLLEEGEP